MIEEPVITITVGTVYRFRAGCRYRVIGLPLDAHSIQQIVVYVGLDGSDRGREFTCSLWNFGLNFTLAVQTNGHAKPVVVERVAGYESKGGGW